MPRRSPASIVYFEIQLVSNNTHILSDHFRRFHTVIGCTGFVAGRSIQLRLARAALGAGVKRFFP
jgi:hypothetical protein